MLTRPPASTTARIPRDPRGRADSQRQPSALAGGFGVASFSGRLAAILSVAAMMVSAGCGEATPDAQVRGGELGQARLALELPTGNRISSVDYEITMHFLEEQPPVTYNVTEYASHLRAGEALIVLPCYTTADGTGMNQVDVKAVVSWINNDGETETVEIPRATAVFECVRNADTRVNLVISVAQQLDAGFTDIELRVTGTWCAGKVDVQGDEWLGVCASSSCGDSDGRFLFANTCEAVNGIPRYYTCGAPTDWVITSILANAVFPIPPLDGVWDFGVVALDPLQMSQVDPTLTDALGNLKVWPGVAMSRGQVTREDGQVVPPAPVNTPANDKTFASVEIYDFAAEVSVAPVNPGEPSPTLLMLVKNAPLGAELSFMRPFGVCDQPTHQINLFPGQTLLDLRRVDDNTVSLLFTTIGGGWAAARATCSGAWIDGAPVISCGAPLPLL